MEQAKSAVEILSELSKKEGWDCDIYEKPVNIRHGITNRIVVVRNPDYKQAYFISVKMQNLSKYGFYSGVFYPVSGHGRFHFHMRKRDVFDNFNLRKNRLRFRTGNNQFDSGVLVEANNEIEAHKLLSSSGIQYKVMSYLYTAERLHIGFNELNPDFNKEMKGQSYLSAFIVNEWMLEKNLILESFKMVEQLRDKLTNI